METLATTSDATPSASPNVELRQYQLHPSQTSLYTERTIESAPLRKSLPLAFFGFPETGGTLNTAVHLYHYPGGLAERSEKRASLAKKNDWKKYLGDVKACMMLQKSEIYVEAGLVKQFDEIKGLQYWVDGHGSQNISSNQKGIIELRRYQLKLGYDTVPEFLSIHNDALPSKLNAAGTHPSTDLVSILVSDIGGLNQVCEIWKHGGENAMEQSRQASRNAKEWRKGIAAIAELAVTFDTSILKPLEFSPLR